MTDGPAADHRRRSRGGACRHAQFNELLNGGGDGFHFALRILSFFRPAARDRFACDVLHDNVSTPPV